MRLRRRRLLALLLISGSGCGETRDGESTSGATPPATSSEGPAITPSGPGVVPQSISVGNTRPETQFVTVAVEFAGTTAFVESRELIPGERHTLRTKIDRAGTYDVVVETATGERTTYRWAVVEGLDGLAVTLVGDIEILRTVRCGPDCALLTNSDGLEEPLVGDGSYRWYAPAQIVLSNPGPPTDAALSVSLGGESVVETRYRVAQGTQVVVPLTYRSGTYRVAVETGSQRVSGPWRVPEEPSRIVDLTTLETGCGPANSQLRVVNANTEPHTLQVTVERDGTVYFSEPYRLDPGEHREVLPVTESGPYTVHLRLDGGPEETEMWWSCPPRGPATILIDMTGTVSVQQSRV